MKMLKRIRQIVAANMNHLLEKAEDPEKMIKQLIREMDESIVALRMEVAKAIAAEKRLARRAEETAQSRRKWLESSEKAVAAGKDDFARQTIGKKIEADKALAELKKQHEKALAVSRTMKEELSQLEDKVQEARRRKEILIARKRRAEAQKAVVDATHEFRKTSVHADSLMADAALESPVSLESLEDAVSDLEAEAEARREVMDASRNTEKALNEAERQEAVEKELEEIRSRVKGNG